MASSSYPRVDMSRKKTRELRMEGVDRLADERADHDEQDEREGAPM
jgi:hypothetical protein